MASSGIALREIGVARAQGSRAWRERVGREKGILIKARFAAALASVAVLSGCVALGWRFGPGFSCRSTDMFADPPVVVHRGEAFFLTWKQGTFPFFFQPDYRAMGGRLVFAVAATTSSGNFAGRQREMEIEGADNLLALRRGGAFWWEREPEPDGTLVRLSVVEQSQQ